MQEENENTRTSSDEEPAGRSSRPPRSRLPRTTEELAAEEAPAEEARRGGGPAEAASAGRAEAEPPRSPPSSFRPSSAASRRARARPAPRGRSARPRTAPASALRRARARPRRARAGGPSDVRSGARRPSEPVAATAPKDGAAESAQAQDAPGRRGVEQGRQDDHGADRCVRRHRVYGKVIRETNTLHAHDETNQAGEGDMVRVVECRPLSRTKRWRLVQVLEKAR